MSKPILSPAISAVVTVLDSLPVVKESTVFGSLLSSPETAADVDIAFVVDAPYAQVGIDRYRRVLRAGAYGTPRYGLLDVFACFSDQVWVRNGDCLGFTRAKNARALRQAMAQGQPWEQWRQGVRLAGEIEPARPTIYFAHPKATYGTALEAASIHTLTAKGWDVVNPADPQHQQACGKDIQKWGSLANSCQALAFLPFEDGAVGAGIVHEASRVWEAGKPVWELDPSGLTAVPVSQWPGNRVLLSVEDTRARNASARVPEPPRRPLGP